MPCQKPQGDWQSIRFSQVISSEDSDSPAVYGDLFPSSGVPIGIVL